MRRQHSILAMGLITYIISCGLVDTGGKAVLDPNNKANVMEVIESDAIEAAEEAYSSINKSIEATKLIITGLPIPPPIPEYETKSSDYFEIQSYGWKCTGNSEGNTTDADDDDIPVNASYIFDCYKDSVRYRGTLSLKDKDDTERESGFNICTGILDTQCSREPITLSDSSVEIERVLDVDVSKNGDVYTFSNLYFKWVGACWKNPVSIETKQKES